MKTAERRAEVEAAILSAAEELLEEGTPFPRLKIEEVARRAGIGRTGFYFYFRDKRELLLRLTEDVVDALYRKGDIWFSGQGDPTEDLHAALRNIAALYRENGAVLRAIVQAAATDDEVAVFWHAILDRFVAATTARIEALQATGHSAVREDPRAAAFVLCWMIERAFNQQLVLGQPLHEDELVDALTGIFVRAVYGSD
jgi:TetR/AcrR family transcriptional regulator, ethionamide resistance regulator